MPRGIKHATDRHSETDVILFVGAIRERILLFSAETGLGSHWVAERLAESLHPVGQPWAQDSLQDLRSGARRNDRAVGALEVAQRPHGDGQTPLLTGEIQGDRGEAVKASRRWTAARRKAQAERMKKQNKKYWAGKKAAQKRDLEKQRVYQARHEARKKGLPPPPLPSQSAA